MLNQSVNDFVNCINARQWESTSKRLALVIGCILNEKRNITPKILRLSFKNIQLLIQLDLQLIPLRD
jgi:hypothetical protein